MKFTEEKLDRTLPTNDNTINNMEEIKHLFAITQKLKDKYTDLNNSVWMGSLLVTSEVLAAEKMSER